MKLEEFKNKIDELYKLHGGDIEVYCSDYQYSRVEEILFNASQEHPDGAPVGVLIV